MATKGGAGNAQAGSILLVVHDFQARSPDELSLAKGDRIELIERDDDFGDGWFLGKHLTNGSSGLFPEVYTTPAPKGTLTNSSYKHRSSDAAPMLAAQTAATNLAMPTPGMGTGSRNVSATQSLPPTVAGASNPMAAAALRTSLPSNGAAGGRTFTITSDSPVMSETLSVIDEHITDMKSPRASYVPNGNKRDTMGSVYSAQHPFRRSYIAGTETDEEEHQLHTEEEVMSWGPERVAEYLEDNGEISGEVLLAMDQNSLFIKEFELGAIGRRLRTWHKIKSLQDEVKRSAAPPELARERSASEYSGVDAEEGAPDTSAVARNRSSTIGAPSLPRGLSTGKRQSGDNMPIRSTTLPEQQMAHVPGGTRRVSTGTSPLQAMTSAPREATQRPSAQGIRNLNHSRRHSSIDSTSTDGATRAGHRKKPSLDQRWELGQTVNGGHKYTASTDMQFPERKSSTLSPAPPEDLDRGYFSSNEVDARSRRAVLTKRNSAAMTQPTVISPMQSRTGSFLNTAPEVREPVSPIGSSSHHTSAMNAIHSKFGNYRSATAPTTNSKLGTSNPIVTKLDHGSSHSLNAIAASPTKIDDNASEASSDKALPAAPADRPSPRINMGMFSSARAKMTGLRSSSDAVTKDEKRSPTKTEDSLKSPTRTGSSTPSTEGKSFDLSKSDIHSRASTGSAGGLLPPPPAKRPRAKTKTKKATSAYTRGLEQKTPQEAMITCDYSGWMKKKSGSLMTTWKTRLFILRGCRLSYYYSDEDTEEKGLIDISFHRVLPAHNETLTGLHATVTGASGGPISPGQGSTPTLAQQDLRNNPPQKGDEDEGMFIFKLVPPKAGLSKGVSFTKPAVHYFAVNSRQEGRLWMAALMKATIDRDDNGVVTTTYNQKTISLQKARERRERPPALKEEGDDINVGGIAELPADDNHDTGLGINGLNGDQQSTMTGAHEDGSMLDASSIAPSTAAESELDLAERQAIALNA
ncbi:Putative SH3 domain, pleckstrin domain, PH-like domain superfamily, SH3-like domain superfamily [Septoria linicola]|uniref:SH3 domain, pleckstrin domain, PH-like domain superfamily, SH3-like domain superfamily n=1 Tax=Septoria linicola TaxID=215465 RepID=A0A9Q9EH37_9PEZI|nr:Putative SH3 domain, pleckstrin domain, PH-like domain superfamily, SH3-like domain superfamily [Septoria linicola]